MSVRGLVVRQDGAAMAVVMGAMLVLSLLAGALAASASHTNGTAARGSDSKRALAAAEAGLHVATQRYAAHRNTLASNQCLAGSDGVTTLTLTSGSDCPTVYDNGDAGDNASFSYVISLPGAPDGAPCHATPGASTVVSANDRCITSTGIVNGVRRRVQTRIGSKAGPPFFGVAGMIGLDSLSFTNSNTINAGVGSNGTITIGNSVTVNGNATLGPGGSVALNGGTLNGSQVKQSEPFALDLNPEFDSAATTNNNSALSSNYYDASTRFFRIPSGTYTLPVVPSGTTTYHFCNFYLDNSVDLRVPTGRKVRILVDSPSRPGSPCTSGGTVTFYNSICVNWPSCGTPGTASNLEFYLAGTGGEDLTFGNSVQVSALFYAPNSKTYINNSIRLNGALAAKVVHVNNSIEFTWPSDARTAPSPGSATAWSGWYECRPQAPVPTDPESGC